MDPGEEGYNARVDHNYHSHHLVVLCCALCVVLRCVVMNEEVPTRAPFRRLLSRQSGSQASRKQRRANECVRDKATHDERSHESIIVAFIDGIPTLLFLLLRSPRTTTARTTPPQMTSYSAFPYHHYHHDHHHHVPAAFLQERSLMATDDADEAGSVDLPMMAPRFTRSHGGGGGRRSSSSSSSSSSPSPYCSPGISGSTVDSSPTPSPSGSTMSPDRRNDSTTTTTTTTAAAAKGGSEVSPSVSHFSGAASGDDSDNGDEEGSVTAGRLLLSDKYPSLVDLHSHHQHHHQRPPLPWLDVVLSLLLPHAWMLL